MPYSVTVHPFPSATRYSCAYERGSPSSCNALVYIGGLTGGPHAIDLSQIDAAFNNSPNLSYSLWEFRMRSSYTGFGFSSLANDADDIASLVKYLRSLGKEKVVLMGHSTGCQDCVEYSNKGKYPDSPAVDGYVLLAPVSDREMGGVFIPQVVMEKSVRVARRLVDKGRGQEVMWRGSIPEIFQSPVTAYRWWSLAAEG
jgi:pimeloyl-ACP methyl ester carboxylesterase